MWGMDSVRFTRTEVAAGWSEGWSEGWSAERLVSGPLFPALASMSPTSSCTQSSCDSHGGSLGAGVGVSQRLEKALGARAGGGGG
jgi:hypothetical protein